MDGQARGIAETQTASVGEPAFHLFAGAVEHGHRVADSDLRPHGFIEHLRDLFYFLDVGLREGQCVFQGLMILYEAVFAAGSAVRKKSVRRLSREAPPLCGYKESPRLLYTL